MTFGPYLWRMAAQRCFGQTIADVLQVIGKYVHGKLLLEITSTEISECARYDSYVISIGIYMCSRRPGPSQNYVSIE